jgi:hypothetical protein
MGAGAMSALCDRLRQAALAHTQSVWGRSPLHHPSGQPRCAARIAKR